jgi:hypothetical protein
MGLTKYQTTFSLTGLEPSTAVLTMSVLADNFVDVYLNGVHVFSPTTQMYTNSVNIVVKASPSVLFLSGTNTLEFDVANQGGPGGLNVSIAGTADPLQSGAPKLDVSPTFVTLTAATVPGSTQADLVGVYARNIGGGGPQKLSFSLASSPSCTNVGGNGFFGVFTPTTTAENGPAMRIQAFSVDPAGTPVKPGFYRTNMRLTMISTGQPDQVQDICVNFLVTPAQLGFSVSKSALAFSAQAGTGTSVTQQIPVLATGGASDWTANIVSQSDFLTITPSSG